MADLFVRGASGDAPTTGSNITFAIDGTGCDALGVWISFNSADTINTCTYAGAACTFKSGLSLSSSRLEFWQKIAPATGSNNVDIAVTGGTWSSLPSAGASMFNGTDQTTPFISIGTNSGTSTQSTITLTSIGASNSGADGVGSPGTISVPSQTQSFLDNNPARDIGGSHAAGNASRTFTWTITASSDWIAIAAEVKAAGVIPSTGAYQQEQSADRYLLEDGSGVYLIEPWGGTGVFLPPFLQSDLTGIGTPGRFFKDRLN